MVRFVANRCGISLPVVSREFFKRGGHGADRRELFLWYTPMKLRSSLCVLVGAVPGALPPVIGWVAATGSLDVGAWVLFAIMFLWQVPHTLAIARLYRKDYARAGFSFFP